MGKRKQSCHSQDRLFLGNQFPKTEKTFSDRITEETSGSKNDENLSSSIKKLKIPRTDLSDDHYILINLTMLQELIKTVNGSSVECSSTEISVKNAVDKQKGWSNKINISCRECGWTKYIYTSKEIDTPGPKSHELNVRSLGLS